MTTKLDAFREAMRQYNQEIHPVIFWPDANGNELPSRVDE